MGKDDSTILITDINKALGSSENEAEKKLAALVTIGGDLNGAIFNLSKKEETFGRSAANSITLDFNGVSRHHFKIFLKEGSWFIEDAGSKNGTYLNNKKLSESEKLNKGDVIKIGNIAFKYLPPGDPERLTYDKLRQEANTDQHTQCYNKTFFNNSLNLNVKKSQITGEPLSLILFDLDHFKKLNDNFGHDAGDYVLKDVAQIVRKSGVRSNDIFARYGGEEFVILLPQTNLKQAHEIAERIRLAINNYEFQYDNQQLNVTISVGLSDYREGVTDGVTLFKRADSAVYQAKEKGRNNVQFFRED